MSATAKNLAAIQAAIDAHNQRCQAAVIEIRMNPFEVGRLGWDDFNGTPIVGDPKVGTGRVRIVCSAVDEGEEADTVAAVGQELPQEVPA